eukprot:7388004-Prymnesium_polylepis.2
MLCHATLFFWPSRSRHAQSWQCLSTPVGKANVRAPIAGHHQAWPLGCLGLNKMAPQHSLGAPLAKHQGDAKTFEST